MLALRSRFKPLPEVEHLRGPESLRLYVDVPDGTPTQANFSRRNTFASDYVPPEHRRGGTNPLRHRFDSRVRFFVWRARFIVV